MKKPLVSIIIPVYNTENYIDECMESIVSQTYDNIEIILAVGLGKDNSLSKCIEWQKKDKRIVILSRNDRGLGDARNYALKIAQGEYISYIDSDDYVACDFIEKLVTPLIDDNEVDMTCCGFTAVNSKKECLKCWTPEINGKYFTDADMHKFYKYISWGCVWIKAYRRQWLIENNLYMFNGSHEDDAFQIMLSANVRVVYFISEPLYFYREDNSNSLMHIVSNRFSYFDAISYAIEFLKENGDFERNKNYIYDLSLNGMKNISLSIDRNTEFDIIKQSFVQKYFPAGVSQFVSEKVKLYPKYAVYGAGNDGVEYIKSADKTKIVCIIDNNLKLSNTEIMGIPVLSFSKFMLKYNDVPIVIASRKFFYEIADSLYKNGITEYCSFGAYKTAELFSVQEKKRIILFNTPTHTNVGDHIIAEEEKEFFLEYLPEYDVLEITDADFLNNYEHIYQYICKEDIIVITGGGFLGTLWMEFGERYVRRVLKDYSDNKIIVFPQTMYFEDTESGKIEMIKTKEIYENCSDLTVMLREKFSYNKAIDLFANCVECELIPDIVLAKKIKQVSCSKHNIAAMCLKYDKEGLLSDEDKKQIRKLLKDKFGIVDEISMHYSESISVEDRKNIIEKKINEIHSYDVIVTDALHCMISCAISSTPCVFFNNISKKLEGVYDWIKKLEYISFAHTPSDITKCVERVMLADKSYTFDYQPYFEKMQQIVRS